MSGSQVELDSEISTLRTRLGELHHLLQQKDDVIFQKDATLQAQTHMMAVLQEMVDNGNRDGNGNSNGDRNGNGNGNGVGERHSEVADLHAQLTSKDDQIAALRRQLRNLESSSSTPPCGSAAAGGGGGGSSGEAVARLMATHHGALEGRLNEIQDEIGELKDVMQDSGDEMQNLRSLVHERDETLSLKDEQLAAKDAKIAEVENNLVLANEQISALKDVIKDKRTIIQHLELQIGEPSMASTQRPRSRGYVPMEQAPGANRFVQEEPNHNVVLRNNPHPRAHLGANPNAQMGPSEASMGYASSFDNHLFWDAHPPNSWER